MDALVEGIQWIIDFFNNIGNFILNFCTSIAKFLFMIPSIVTFTTSAIGFLPSAVIIFATTCVTVSVVMLVVGRSNNG